MGSGGEDGEDFGAARVSGAPLANRTPGLPLPVVLFRRSLSLRTRPWVSRDVESEKSPGAARGLTTGGMENRSARRGDV